VDRDGEKGEEIMVTRQSEERSLRNAQTRMINEITRDHMERCFDRPSAFEGATIGNQHYLLLYTFHRKSVAARVVKKIHSLGYGARSIKGAGRVTGTVYYFVYARRK
jgi:hypothetical protein